MKKIFFLLLVVLTACEQNRSEPIEPYFPIINEPMNSNPTPNSNAELTYLALGDSYTIGESVKESDRWPVQFQQLLRKSGYNYTTPKIIAKTGWTTDELKAAIKAENLQGKFDLVTLLIGVNDQYRGRNVADFRVHYKELLEMAIAFAGNKTENVIVVSIPDWGVSPFAQNRDRDKISKEIDLYNSVKREETLKKDVKFVDITGISRQALNNESYIASDGLHFSGAMYQLWVNEIFTRTFN